MSYICSVLNNYNTNKVINMVEISDLTFGYTRRKMLFNKLNLTLKPGNIYGLLGKNGAGKTTLLKHISGLIFPNAGSCQVFDSEAGQRLPETLQDIFLIPEEFSLPAIKGVAFGAINAPFYPNFDTKEFYALLNEMEVDAQANLSKLSYGQKKKFLIAFGLATHARLLILDEPTNGLDIPSKSQFRKIVASRFNEDRAIIISTHQVRDLSNLIDHVVILDSGSIIFHEPLASISEKFSFGLVREGEQQDMVYAEEALGGKAAMYMKKGKETEVDLEILFSAVMNNVNEINNHLK